MTYYLCIILVAAFVLSASPSVGLPQQQPAAPDAASIISKMKEALDPATSSVRIMTLKTITRKVTPVLFKLGQARGEANGSRWMLTVVLSPRQAQGAAVLDEDRPAATASEYIYLPAAQRVQKFSPLEAWEPFLGSEFSYMDFGFFRSNSHITLKGVEAHDGIKCYRLEEPLSKIPYYSKMNTWVAVATALPVEREYYDREGKPYKSERYERTMMIQNIPTIMRILMRNLQQRSSSEIDITSVKYDKKAPQALFDPNNLSRAATDPFWKGQM